MSDEEFKNKVLGILRESLTVEVETDWGSDGFQNVKVSIFLNGEWISSGNDYIATNSGH
jgi:hypothetical protein